MIRKIIILGISVVLLCGSIVVYSQEKITITTYYPAPYGVYKELESYITRMKYLQLNFEGSSYHYLRISKGPSVGAADASGNYIAGIMWNKNSPTYGDGDDFTIFTYGGKDIYLYTGGKTVLKSNHTRVTTSTGNPGVLRVKEIWFCNCWD